MFISFNIEKNFRRGKEKGRDSTRPTTAHREQIYLQVGKAKISSRVKWPAIPLFFPFLSFFLSKGEGERKDRKKGGERGERPFRIPDQVSTISKQVLSVLRILLPQDLGTLSTSFHANSAPQSVPKHPTASSSLEEGTRTRT